MFVFLGCGAALVLNSGGAGVQASHPCRADRMTDTKPEKTLILCQHENLEAPASRANGRAMRTSGGRGEAANTFKVKECS